MNFKTLVFVALIATAIIADDTFLVDNEVDRFLTSYTATQITAVCTADSACLNVFSGLAGCCASWKRSITAATTGTVTTTALGSYCTPAILVSSNNWFTYSSYNYSATACTTTTNTQASLLGTACTSNSNCV